jgi:hypothetical protein
LTSIATLCYLYLRHPPGYRWARRSCILINLLAAIFFALYPVAPPRLTPSMSMVDTVQSQHIWGTWGSDIGDSANQFAALPSLHVALVLWVLIMLYQATRSLVLRLLGWLNLFLTCIVVICTGNHFVLDLVAAFVLTIPSIVVTRPGLPPWPHRGGRLVALLRSTAILTRPGPS